MHDQSITPRPAARPRPLRKLQPADLVSIVVRRHAGEPLRRIAEDYGITSSYAGMLFRATAERQAATREQRRRRYDRITSALIAYKARRSCIACGESDPAVLQFHHIDPATKSFTISASALRSAAKLEAEIEKCWVVCYRCHRALSFVRHDV